MIPDHPTIRQMENKGHVGTQPFIIGECRYCNYEISDQEEAYESDLGNLICSDRSCLVEHALMDLEQIK